MLLEVSKLLIQIDENLNWALSIPLGKYIKIKGEENIIFSGYFIRVFCLDGTCIPYYKTNNACKEICGKDSCIDAVDPGVKLKSIFCH
jgi:hypothetical protein